MKLNKQQLITFTKTYLPLLIAYILLQVFAFVIGFTVMNSWRSFEKWIPMSKWPNWYMCLLSIPLIYYVIKYKVEKEYYDNKK